jgi:F-type H+-transporting ATPase subunit b
MTALFAAETAANPLAPDFVTMGVTLVVFVLLLTILYVTAWGPILAGLRKREAGMFAARDEAAKVKHEAEELRTKLQAEFAQANDRIRAMMDEARKDADALKASEREVGKKEAATELDRARRQIAAETEAAMDSLRKQAIELAGLMATKAVRRNLDLGDKQALLNESLAELKQTVKA